MTNLIWTKESYGNECHYLRTEYKDFYCMCTDKEGFGRPFDKQPFMIGVYVIYGNADESISYIECSSYSVNLRDAVASELFEIAEEKVE